MTAKSFYSLIVLWAIIISFISITSAIDLKSSNNNNENTSSLSTTAVPLLFSSSGSSSTTTPSSLILSQSTSTTLHPAIQSLSYRKSHQLLKERKKSWPTPNSIQNSGPINYYQLAKAYNYPLQSNSKSSSGQQQSSLASFVSNIFSPFNKVMSRRVAGGKLFSLVDQFNSNGNNNFLANAAAAAVAAASAAGSGLEYPGSASNVEALNEAVSNVMMGLNGLQPNQANQLAGQLGSYLSAAAAANGIDVNTKNGKKLLDFPKQWYKQMSEKLSGASEAAYSATVPIKESFMNTVKSFYSYIKPSRSQVASPFGDSSNMMAAAASAAASQDSLMNSGQNSNQNNPKRRQSDSYSGYYYNNINYPGKMMSALHHENQQHYPQALAQHMPQLPPSAAYPQPYSNKGRYPINAGEYSPQHFSNIKSQPQQQPSAIRSKSAASKSNNNEMMVMESQASPSVDNLKKQYIQYMGKQPVTSMNQQVLMMPPQSSATTASDQQQQQSSLSKYDQMLNQMIQQSIQQSQQHFMGNNNPGPAATTPSAINYNTPKHQNALYQKSKEIFSRFTKKRVPSQQQQQQQQFASAPYNSIPMMAEYGGFGQRLPAQTIARVSNKLPSLPLAFNSNNNNNNNQQQQQKQSSSTQQFSSNQQSNRIESLQSLPSSMQSTKTNKNSQQQHPHNYYTQQPINQSPYAIQPVYPPPSQQTQQQQHTLPTVSSTISPPISTSTSVSISMHQSISSHYDEHQLDNKNSDHYNDNIDQQQQVQYQPPSSSSSSAAATNLEHLKSFLDNNHNMQQNVDNVGNDDINIQHNQGSVYYYYDQPQQYHQSQQQLHHNDKNGQHDEIVQNNNNNDNNNQKK